eukprot:SAG11_NODE_1586_length_4636_cov_9.336125_5_plen_128_part_00
MDKEERSGCLNHEQDSWTANGHCCYAWSYRAFVDDLQRAASREVHPISFATERAPATAWCADADDGRRQYVLRRRATVEEKQAQQQRSRQRYQRRAYHRSMKEMVTIGLRQQRFSADNKLTSSDFLQ